MVTLTLRLPRTGYAWSGALWAARLPGRLPLWVQLQREFHRRNLLSLVATKRLETLGIEWEPKVHTLVIGT